mmetsp:Transcript_111312/g.321872  ORF Transcript_111312/g.321872 Transcript_111312/m.321872 type:complete len:170 (+) Transcript_111312:1228-1737(+)
MKSSNRQKGEPSSNQSVSSLPKMTRQRPIQLWVMEIRYKLKMMKTIQGRGIPKEATVVVVAEGEEGAIETVGETAEVAGVVAEGAEVEGVDNPAKRFSFWCFVQSLIFLTFLFAPLASGCGRPGLVGFFLSVILMNDDDLLFFDYISPNEPVDDFCNNNHKPHCDENDE